MLVLKHFAFGVACHILHGGTAPPIRLSMNYCLHCDRRWDWCLSQPTVGSHCCNQSTTWCHRTLLLPTTNNKTRHIRSFLVPNANICTL